LYIKHAQGVTFLVLFHKVKPSFILLYFYTFKGILHDRLLVPHQEIS
jgi:hypothetical protein